MDERREKLQSYISNRETELRIFSWVGVWEMLTDNWRVYGEDDALHWIAEWSSGLIHVTGSVDDVRNWFRAEAGLHWTARSRRHWNDIDCKVEGHNIREVEMVKLQINIETNHCQSFTSKQLITSSEHRFLNSKHSRIYPITHVSNIQTMVKPFQLTCLLAHNHKSSSSVPWTNWKGTFMVGTAVQRVTNQK